MFWGISMCSGKKYSQVSESSLIMTMAALEPKGSTDPSVESDISEESSDRQICLMIEKQGNEYLICTLEYGRVMQTCLNLHIDKGEKYVMFITGEGVVHISGYTVEENKPNGGDAVMFSQYKEISEQSCGILVDSDDCKEEDDDEEEDEEDVDTHRLLTLDDSAEEDNESEEWEPDVSELEGTFGCDYMYGSRPQTRSKKKHVYFEEDGYEDQSYMLPQLDVDVSSTEENVYEEDADAKHDENEGTNNESDEDTSDEDEELDLEEVESLMKDSSKKRKKSALTNSQSKRSKNEEVRPLRVEFVGSFNSSKKSKKMKKERIVMENSINNVGEDDLNSSIGRTPIPKKKAMKCHFDGKESPSTSGKGSAKKMKFSNKLSNGVEYEDLRMGIGPMARSGKIIHVHYIGKFTNGDVFERCMPNEKAYAFRLGRGEVIKGWDAGIEGMKVGGKRKMKIPPSMAYGKREVGCIPPNSTVIFTIELKAVS